MNEDFEIGLSKSLKNNSETSRFGIFEVFEYRFLFGNALIIRCIGGGRMLMEGSIQSPLGNPSELS